jgi:hypothetical protein
MKRRMKTLHSRKLQTLARVRHQREILRDFPEGGFDLSRVATKSDNGPGSARLGPLCPTPESPSTLCCSGKRSNLSVCEFLTLYARLSGFVLKVKLLKSTDQQFLNFLDECI